MAAKKPAAAGEKSNSRKAFAMRNRGLKFRPVSTLFSAFSSPFLLLHAGTHFYSTSKVSSTKTDPPYPNFQAILTYLKSLTTGTALETFVDQLCTYAASHATQILGASVIILALAVSKGWRHIEYYAMVLGLCLFLPAQSMSMYYGAAACLALHALAANSTTKASILGIGALLAFVSMPK